MINGVGIERRRRNKMMGSKREHVRHGKRTLHAMVFGVKSACGREVRERNGILKCALGH